MLETDEQAQEIPEYARDHGRKRNLASPLAPLPDSLESLSHEGQGSVRSSNSALRRC